jgi:transposase InsO family protein
MCSYLRREDLLCKEKEKERERESLYSDSLPEQRQRQQHTLIALTHSVSHSALKRMKPKMREMISFVNTEKEREENGKGSSRIGKLMSPN